jgi:hypothetical protein
MGFFFDVGRRLAAISEKGHPLERLDQLVWWENFRLDLEEVDATHLLTSNAHALLTFDCSMSD